MKQSHALAYLRQICCAGLSREIAIAEFLRAVPMLIQSNSNSLSVCDAQPCMKYHILGFDAADMAPLISGIASDFHTPKRYWRAVAWFMRYPTIGNPKVLDEAFYSSDLYNLIYRPFDMHHVLWAPLHLDAEHTGVIGLYRSSHQKPFDSRDQVRLSSLLPYVVHAYRADHNGSFEVSPEGQSGMMIMSGLGTLLYQSAEAKRLLELAKYPRLLIERRQDDRLMAKLAKMCCNLRNIFRGCDAPPPSFTHIGPNGQFLFRAYWLDGCHHQPDGLIGITIEHREPLMLKILRTMRDLPLSPTQKEVALLLAQGVTFEQIGKRLHIKQTTVKDHVGKLYAKLDIHQREELLPKLLAASLLT